MNPETLVRMANQIATFFHSQPEDEAVAATADHLAKFWDPRMRRQLGDLIAAGGKGLDPIALAAGKRVAPN
jgi:formate dehydrogenase subunit delta